MLQAFYDNQVAFNNDPSRSRIEMHGTVKEVTQEDGTVLVMANIVYTSLPLSLYELDSWDNALWAEFAPEQAEKVLEDGFMNARVYVEMEIPSPGAPLHFWDSYFSGGLRQLTFVGHGEGWLVDENGQRTGRAMVDINDAAETFRITLGGVPASHN